MLQTGGTTTEVNSALRFYVPVKTATDSAFPFDAEDPYVLRVVEDAVVITPATCERDVLELPAIDDDVRDDLPSE